MTTLKKEYKGQLGLYLVCVELSKRNMTALPTSRNLSGYDVIVFDKTTGRSKGLQVKCSDKGDFPILSSHFADYVKKIVEKVVCDFIFVDISDMDKPTFCLVSRDALRQVLTDDTGRYLNEYSIRHQQPESETRRDKELGKKANVWAVRLKSLQDASDLDWENLLGDAGS